MTNRQIVKAKEKFLKEIRSTGSVNIRMIRKLNCPILGCLLWFFWFFLFIFLLTDILCSVVDMEKV